MRSSSAAEDEDWVIEDHEQQEGAVSRPLVMNIVMDYVAAPGSGALEGAPTAAAEAATMAAWPAPARAYIASLTSRLEAETARVSRLLSDKARVVTAVMNEHATGGGGGAVCVRAR